MLTKEVLLCTQLRLPTTVSPLARRYFFGGLFAGSVQPVGEPPSVSPPPVAPSQRPWTRPPVPAKKMRFLDTKKPQIVKCEMCSAQVLSESLPLPKKARALTAEAFKELLLHIDTFIFDADGVLWLGEAAIPGSPAFVDFLLSEGKRVIILTNNATKSRATYAKKLHKLGYSTAINEEMIVNPAAVVAEALKLAGLHGDKKVFVIGCQGIRDELDRLNISHFGGGKEQHEALDGAEPFIYDLEELDGEAEDVGAVVVGYEKHFNYVKLMKAANFLQDSDCIFLATNEDETCPGPKPGVVIPDAGPLVAAVKTAAGREPVVVGKPNTAAFEYICRRWKIEPSKTLMVGDRTNTDVKFGRDHGLRTLLVLSGCHGMEDVVDHQSNRRNDMIPDYFAPSLGDLLPTHY